MGLVLCPLMDYLWTPWRYPYLATAAKAPSCIFCGLQRSDDDRKALIVHRAKYNFIILNAYPYTSGHSMVVPYEHIDRLHELPQAAASEMMELVQRMETVLYEVYQCNGVNLGMNVGKAAGAGVAGHIHMHVLPRWIADSNFMTVIGEARVLPELLEETYQRLKEKF
jgi:ATP adenylyltransferase